MEKQCQSLDKTQIDENCLAVITEANVVLSYAAIGKLDNLTSCIIWKFKDLPVQEATFTINLDNVYLDNNPDVTLLVEKIFPDTIRPLVKRKLLCTFPDIEFKDVQILIVSREDLDCDEEEQDGMFYDVNLVITISREIIQEE